MQHMEIEQFGKELLDTGDLDPVYNALAGMRMPRTQLSQWLVGYWAFYNAGLASYLSDAPHSDAFWARFQEAVKNETEAPCGGRWPRGGERRHYRGMNALLSYQDLRIKYQEPAQMLDYVSGEMSLQFGDAEQKPMAFSAVSKRAQEHVGFGPWMGFKIADMLERVMGVKIDFTGDDVFMFKDPREAALKLFHSRHRIPTSAKVKEQAVIKQVVSYLLGHFKDYKAPPHGDRSVNIQEIETILCKWKSHCNGHYPVGHDTKEIGKSIQPWMKVSETAAEFHYYLPKP